MKKKTIANEVLHFAKKWSVTKKCISSLVDFKVPCPAPFIGPSTCKQKKKHPVESPPLACIQNEFDLL